MPIGSLRFATGPILPCRTVARNRTVAWRAWRGGVARRCHALPRAARQGAAVSKAVMLRVARLKFDRR